MISKSNALIIVCVSFALGVLLASVLEVSRLWIYSGLIVGIVLFTGLFLNKNFLGAQCAFFLLAIILGALRLQISLAQNEYSSSIDSKQQLEGLVIEEPDIRQDRQLITFRPDNFSQNILLSTTKAQSFFYGDRLAVSGKIAAAKAFDDFDYPKYLERFNVYALEKYPKILILKSGQGNWFKYRLLKIKAAFVARVNSLLQEPQGSLLLGILIGARKSLPQNVVDNFNTTGVSHIIAVSGFNITIIVGGLLSLAKLFGRRVSFWLSLFCIFAFVIVAGASASVVRAAIMGVLLLLALNSGRQYSIAPSLFFAALIMLLFNPRILFWDIGFQLSFAATLGIIYFSPLISSKTEGLGDLFGLKTLLITTFSAIVATLPLMLLYFGQMSLVAPLVNILILPLLPTLMLVGFLIVLPVVGSGFAFVANILLNYVLKVTEIFAAVKFSSLEVHLNAWSFWASVGVVLVFYYLLSLKRLKKSNVRRPSSTGEDGLHTERKSQLNKF